MKEKNKKEIDIEFLEDVLDDEIPSNNNQKKIKIHEEEISKERKLRPKLYFSFEARVVGFILGILILFSIASFLIFKIIKEGQVMEIPLKESGNIDYQVCFLPNTIYSDNCLKGEREYLSSITDKIYLQFLYETKFEKDFSFSEDYYVDASLKISSSKDESEVYTPFVKHLLSDKTASINGGVLSIQEEVIVDYQEYLTLLSNYHDY